MHRALLLLLGAGLALPGLGVQAAEPLAPSASPVAECLRMAEDRGLTGAARDQFLRECVSARLAPGAPNPTAEPADPPIHC